MNSLIFQVKNVAGTLFETIEILIVMSRSLYFLTYHQNVFTLGFLWLSISSMILGIWQLPLMCTEISLKKKKWKRMWTRSWLRKRGQFRITILGNWRYIFICIYKHLAFKATTSSCCNIIGWQHTTVIPWLINLLCLCAFSFPASMLTLLSSLPVSQLPEVQLSNSVLFWCVFKKKKSLIHMEFIHLVLHHLKKIHDKNLFSLQPCGFLLSYLHNFLNMFLPHFSLSKCYTPSWKLSKPQQW